MGYTPFNSYDRLKAVASKPVMTDETEAKRAKATTLKSKRLKDPFARIKELSRKGKK